MMIAAKFIPLAVVAPVITAAAFTDLRMMRIPNTLVLLALGLFVLTLPFLFHDTHEMLWRTLAGVATFVVCFALFALRVFGGGDAKLFPVIMLFVPTSLWSEFLMTFSLSMGITMALFLPVRRMVPAEMTGWKSLTPDGRFPMGIAFATAVVGFLLIFTGFS